MEETVNILVSPWTVLYAVFSPQLWLPGSLSDNCGPVSSPTVSVLQGWRGGGRTQPPTGTPGQDQSLLCTHHCTPLALLSTVHFTRTWSKSLFQGIGLIYPDKKTVGGGEHLDFFKGGNVLVASTIRVSLENQAEFIEIYNNTRELGELTD